jgi:hypothetical protein
MLRQDRDAEMVCLARRSPATVGQRRLTVANNPTLRSAAAVSAGGFEVALKSTNPNIFAIGRIRPQANKHQRNTSH